MDRISNNFININVARRSTQENNVSNNYFINKNESNKEEFIESLKNRKNNLQNANLEGADLSGANLEGANLEGANLEGFRGMMNPDRIE